MLLLLGIEQKRTIEVLLLRLLLLLLLLRDFIAYTTTVEMAVNHEKQLLPRHLKYSMNTDKTEVI